MAITEDEERILKQTEIDLKNQTVFFPVVAGFLAFLMIISVYFYHTVEKWDVLNSFYFVVVTMATVGYGDLTPTTSVAKLYTIFLIVIGIATFTTFITQLLKRQGLKRVHNQLSGKQSRFTKNLEKVKKQL